jgi:hypothetical protein
VQVLLVLVQALALKQAQLVRVQRARQLLVQRVRQLQAQVQLVQAQKLFVKLSELVEFRTLALMLLK